MKNISKIKIPKPKRDGPLLFRFFPIILIGADKVLDKGSQLYIRLFVRLVDKAFSEYENARRLLTKELRTNDKLANRFNIINHLENSVNAISRSIKILNTIARSKDVDKKNNNPKIKQKNKLSINLLNFLSAESIEKVKKYKTSSIRNRIEHIDEDICFDDFKKDLFLDIDSNYEKITINNKSILLTDYVKILESYHQFVLEIFSNLPNRITNGKYYYDKK